MIDTVARTAQEIVDEAITKLPARWDWFYCDHDDGLTAEQIHKILTTEDGYNDVAMEIEDNNFESKWQAVQELIEEVVPDEDEREVLEADETLLGRLKDAIYDLDRTDVVKELARNQRIYVRYHLGTNQGDYIDLAPNSWNWTAGQVYRAARHLCALAKLPWAEHGEKFRELVVNATYGGELFIFWYADLSDVIEAINAHLADPTEKRTITWTNPTFLLLDYYNGSGHEFRLDGEYSRAFDYERLSVDGSFGYSWDEICGLVSRYYATEFKVEAA